jgi:hypothetical protein
LFKVAGDRPIEVAPSGAAEFVYRSWVSGPSATNADSS